MESARFLLSLGTPGALELVATTAGEGSLGMTMRQVDPLTSSPRGEGETKVRQTQGGEVTWVAALPRTAEGILQVDLSWSSSGETAAALSIEHLKLVQSNEARPPSILFISIDTLSAQHTSLYGYGRETTPELDEFAKEAVVFDRCVSNAPWTTPSYTALFTGLYPSSVSMDFGGETDRFLLRVPEGRWTLAESLRASGYQTAGFIDALHMGERYGFSQGFDLFDESAAEIDQEDPLGGLRHMLPKALEWMEQAQESGPFFCFLHAYDVHGPYLPDEPQAGEFHGDELFEAGGRMDIGALPHAFGSVPTYITEPVDAVAEADGKGPVAPFVASYDEEILALDSALGGFFRELKQRGLLDQIVVVITADHGESTDDHNYFGHGLLYNEVLQVPLVVRMPSGQGGGQRVPVAAQLVDLYPTLAEIAGLGGGFSWMHGRSLVPLLRGDPLPSKALFSEGGIMTQSALELDGWKLIEMRPGSESLPWTMLSQERLPRSWIAANAPEVLDQTLTTERVTELRKRFQDSADPMGEYKAWVKNLSEQIAGPVYELYDLASDPMEKHNLSREHPERVQQMLTLLQRYQALRDESREYVEETAVGLKDEDLERLQRMGYVGGD
ncbi:MAG: arylsulfatase A-like enzyme [Planctomycetota bacterium]|jgi:arylsulfatase A-like enzyme